MGGGKFGREGQFSEAPDGSLNDMVSKIRRVNVGGTDAFTLFKQGAISKAKLCELIAKDLEAK